ncbi:MAG TPA: hypothetical protein VGO66_12225 [Solirubrobacterales bacterium]|jgi:hypothetical protein|nr:hypothetical protein [Solirubrobacterales bacterium]
MNSRLTVLAVTAVLLAAFAVPALAAPSEATPDVQGISTRALAKARLALLTARSAKAESRRAARTAQAAINTSNDAVKTAGEAKSATAATQATLDSTKVQSAFAAGGVATSSKKFVQLPGGPSVTVSAPPSGLIEVWAQATMSDAGAVSLYEDGQQMLGQNEFEFCVNEESGGSLFAASGIGPPGPATLGTPSPAGFCGTEGAPGSVLLQTTPGSHTYELRYELLECGCAPDVMFSKRLLRVGPRL